MTAVHAGVSSQPEDVAGMLVAVAPPTDLLMEGAEPREVAAAIQRAASIEARGRLLWGLSPEDRREVLDELHPGFVGALIQNNEAENKRLLGDLSREQFNRLLRFCSPGQAYYWLALATSFEDARANMLPLLAPVDEVARALISVPEFAEHCQEVGDYPMEDLNIDWDEFAGLASVVVSVFEGKEMIEEFPVLDGAPVRDPRLRWLLGLLEHDPDRYTALVTVTTADGKVDEVPVGDPRLGRLFHRLLDHDLQQYTALLNLFGAEGVLQEFPIKDRRLRRLVRTVLDFDPAHYAALIQAALSQMDYDRDRTEEERSAQQ